jgi:Na+/H+ antiporter NhaA
LLAFEEEALQEQAKLAILVASAVAGAIALTALWVRAHRHRSRESPNDS